MWIVFEMEGTGLTDELVRVIGPFETEEAAEAYCEKDGLAVVDERGIMQVEAPDEADPVGHRMTDADATAFNRAADELLRKHRGIT